MNWADPINSYMKTEQLQHRLIQELADIVEAHFRKNLKQIQIDYDSLFDDIELFFEHFRNRPIIDNTGGSGFHNCLWLYITCKALKPEIIVESGVLKGMTSWILWKACPDTSLYCFDPNLTNLQYQNEEFEYIEDDWSSYKFKTEIPENAIVFFDCHINQARRTKEAYDRGFKYLIFDDNPPAHKLYTYGLPGLPTISMLFDESLKEGSLIEWYWNNVYMKYEFRETDTYGAKDLIKHYSVFPDLTSNTRYDMLTGGHSFLTFVELID